MRKKYFGRVRYIKESQHTIAIPNGRIDFTLKKSSRRRTISISVDKKARIAVAAPSYSADKEIFQFINEKAKWISDKVIEAQKYQDDVNQKKFEHGYYFLFMGKEYPIKIEQRDRKRTLITFNGSCWQVLLADHIGPQQRQKHIKEKMLKWYREQAKEVLGGRIFHFARIIGLGPQRIAIRSQKRVWGNCDTRTQTINLNWQIILTPLSVIDYIIVHELCHLKVPNHSQRFWLEVKKILPQYKESVKWLKIHAIDLAIPEDD
ncbi:MAG: M48 family metallopeptidase [Candidatus Omnitrophica bacterium]|nr:M48 family metallopeptidase [Candidatus Omnitrophota bacterium]